MKRALAERAKQQTDEQHRAVSAVSVPGGVSLNVSGIPPNKMPRTEAPSKNASSGPGRTGAIINASAVQNLKVKVEAPKATPTKVTSSSSSSKTIKSIPSSPRKTKSPVPQNITSSSSSSTTKSKKRIRPPALSPPPAEPDDSDQSAFYLKHQNKALASELHQYKFMINILEREREKRRKECREIGKSVRELEGVWRGVERVIVDQLGEAVKDYNDSRSSVRTRSRGRSLS